MKIVKHFLVIKTQNGYLGKKIKKQRIQNDRYNFKS